MQSWETCRTLSSDDPFWSQKHSSGLDEGFDLE